MPTWIWETWSTPGIALGWLATLVVAAVFTLRLLRDETRLLSQRVAWTLLALRCGVLAGLLFLAWQPVLSWQTVQEEQGTWLIARDWSDSMNVVDRQSTELEKAAAAQALGLIGQAPWLEAWKKSVARGGPPIWISPTEAVAPAQRAALEQVRKSLLQTALDKASTLSRREIVDQLLATHRDRWQTSSPTNNDWQEAAFAADVAWLSPETPSPPDLVTGQTNWQNLLQASLSRHRESPLKGLLVFSDGRETTQQEARLLGMAETLAAANIPLFAVPVGAAARPQDLSLAALDLPPQVQKGDQAQLKILLGSFGYRGQSLPLRIEVDGQLLEERQIIATGGLQTITVPIPTEEFGVKQVHVSLAPKSGEASANNNHREISFLVTDQRTQVLLVDGEARWEFRYLDAMFARDPGIKLEHVLFQQPFAGLLPEPFFPRRLSWETKNPLTDDSETTGTVVVDQPDLIILGDVPAESFPESAWEQIAQRVSEDGATLVLGAGQRFFPLTHRSQTLQKLLPVNDLRKIEVSTEVDQPPQRPAFAWRLSADGSLIEPLALRPDAESNRAQWAELPGPAWILAGTPKPAATVWLEVTSSREVASGEAGQAWPAVVHQPYGSGQVLWMGMDCTWRWRKRTAETIHHRFWGQLARWAAATRGGGGQGPVRLKLDRNLVTTGEHVTAEVLWSVQPDKPTPPEQTSLELYRQTSGGLEPLQTVIATGVTDRPLLQTVTLPELEEGEYLVRVPASALPDQTRPVEAPFFVRTGFSSELADVSVNRDLLQKLTRTTGGRIIELSEVAEWSGLPAIPSPASQQARGKIVSLWSQPFVMIGLLGLLIANWVIRRRAGLP